MKTLYITISIFLLLTMSQLAQAYLKLELVSGMRSTRPIAVVQFSNEDSLPLELQPSKIISADLLNTGEFSVSTGKTLPAQPNTVSAVKLAQWRNLEVQDLIIGSVKKIAGQKYRVAISLIAVYGATTKTGDVAPSAVLFSRSYTVNKDQLRQLSHQLSDKIYYLLTGKHGIFTTKIAYVLVTPSRMAKHPEFKLMVADYDGYHAKNLVTSSEPIMSPAWSHNRADIAFVSFRAKRPAIYKVNISTGMLTQLTSTGALNGAPAWSPADDQLAYASASKATGNVPKIYLLDIATKKIQQLTTGYAIDTEPSFSPDGKTLVFTSNRGGAPQIYQYNFASTDIERLTYSGDYNARPSICGNKLVTLQGDKDLYNIAVTDLNTDQTQVLTHSGNDESPSWSPNCQLIVYATEQNKRPALAIVSADGKVNINLPASKGDVLEPVWQ